MMRIATTFPMIAGVMWGTVGIFVRNFTAFGMDTPTVLFLRLSSGAIITLTILAVIDRDALRIRLKDLWIFALCGIVGMAGLNYCYNTAINQLTLSLAAVLLSMCPVFVLIASAILFGEKITPRKVGCMLVAILGCTMVSGIFDGTGQHWSVAGILIGIGSAMCYAVNTISSKMLTDRDYHPLTLVLYSSLLATVLLVPVADYHMLISYALAEPAKNGMMMLLHALLTFVLPYIFYANGIRASEAGLTTIIAAGAEPASAMVFGAIAFAEVPSVISIAGLGVTVLALFYLCRPEE